MPRKKKVTHEKVEVTTPDEIVNENDVTATLTDLEPDAPPMSQTVNRGFVPSVPIPEPDLRYDPNRPETFIELVSQAWEESKGSDDAGFKDAAPEFQRLLVDHAKDVLRTNVVQEGDTSWARFEQSFFKLKNKGE